MDTVRVRTRVLPGRRIELETPDIAEGEDVEVTIRSAEIRKSARSILDLVASLNGHRLFQSPEEVDRYLQQERDSWDR